MGVQLRNPGAKHVGPNDFFKKTGNEIQKTYLLNIEDIFIEC